MPAFFYGTAWKEDATEGLVRQALAAGFRAIDTANQRKHYFEEEVGRALRASSIPRDELFIQTKYTFQNGQDDRLPYDPAASIGEQVRQSFASSLEHLGVDRIDSLVLHGPATAHGIGELEREAWQAMESLVHEGRVRLLGASNLAASQLAKLLDMATIAPAFIQNRCYARMHWDRDTREVCAANDITYQAFSLLTANRGAVAHVLTHRIAERYGCTNPQVIFRFATQLGMIPLTGSSDPEHMAQDLAIDAFELDADAMAKLRGLYA